MARQNGKTTKCKVKALRWILLDQVPLVLGTSTKLDYARESWEGAVSIAEASPDLLAEFPLTKAGTIDARRTNGEQTLSTLAGCRYKIAAANRDGGRSLTVHRLISDELRQHRTWDAWAAATKAGMAVPDFQAWAITNAGDMTSIPLNALRAQALEQMASPEPIEGQIGFFSWSAPDDCAIDDRDAWAQANPSLGYTITQEAIQAALMTDPEAVFRTEVLCQTVLSVDPVPIRLPDWLACSDESSMPTGRPMIAIAVSRDGQSAAVAAAGTREDGKAHVEILAQGRGSDWVVEFCKGKKQARPIAWVLDKRTPAAALLPDLKAAGITPREMSTSDCGQACASLQAAVKDRAVRHLGDEVLTAAVAGAARRDIGDGLWAWSAKSSEVDIVTLVAATNALWLLSVTPKPRPLVAFK